MLFFLLPLEHLQFKFVTLFDFIVRERPAFHYSTAKAIVSKTQDQLMMAMASLSFQEVHDVVGGLAARDEDTLRLALEKAEAVAKDEPHGIKYSLAQQSVNHG